MLTEDKSTPNGPCIQRQLADCALSMATKYCIVQTFEINIASIIARRL